MAAGREFAIGAGEAGLRLDRYLCKLLRRVPRSAIFRHLREGRIRVDGGKATPDLRLEAGMVVAVALATADLPDAGAADYGAAPAFTGRAPRIVHQDRDLLVVDKPSGMASQPGSGQGSTHLLAWLRQSGLGEPSATFAPAPAHRLDRGTSGLVVIGLTPAGLRGAAALFRSDAVRKVYFAVVHGVPHEVRFELDEPLLTRPDARAGEPRTVVDARGRPARTSCERVAAVADRALVRLELHHGRMHQIRAHLAHAGHPVVGDRRYGSPARLGDAFLLHAAELSLIHPTTGELLCCTAPLPPGFWRGPAAGP